MKAVITLSPWDYGAVLFDIDADAGEAALSIPRATSQFTKAKVDFSTYQTGHFLLGFMNSGMQGLPVSSSQD